MVSPPRVSDAWFITNKDPDLYVLLFLLARFGSNFNATLYASTGDMPTYKSS